MGGAAATPGEEVSVLREAQHAVLRHAQDAVLRRAQDACLGKKVSGSEQ